MATNMRELTQRAKQQPVKSMGGSSVQQFFEGNRSAIEAALPKHMNAERMLKVAMHAIRTTPALMECNTASLMGAVIQASALGLEPNTVLGHAYLVPFNNRQRGQKEVQLIPGYRGLIDLARRSGQIESIYAHEVCENDHFRIRLGTEGSIEHEPAMDGRGEIIGAYAVAKFRDGGGHQFEFMPVQEINRIRDGSQGYQSAIRYKKDHPWINHYAQMARKTVIRRLSKTLPLSIEFATATALDEQAEIGTSQGLGEVLDGTYTVTPDDAPPAEATDEEPTPTDGKGPQDAPQGQPTKANAPPADAPSPDYYVTGLQKASSIDELDTMMAEASDVLSGGDKQRATKAYKARKGELMGADQQQGDFL